jgi:hypothetical protein
MEVSSNESIEITSIAIVGPTDGLGDAYDADKMSGAHGPRSIILVLMLVGFSWCWMAT